MLGPCDAADACGNLGQKIGSASVSPRAMASHHTHHHAPPPTGSGTLSVGLAQGTLDRLQNDERQKDDERNFPDATDELASRYGSETKELKGTAALPRIAGKSIMLYRFIHGFTSTSGAQRWEALAEYCDLNDLDRDSFLANLRSVCGGKKGRMNGAKVGPFMNTFDSLKKFRSRLKLKWKGRAGDSRKPKIKRAHNVYKILVAVWQKTFAEIQSSRNVDALHIPTNEDLVGFGKEQARAKRALAKHAAEKMSRVGATDADATAMAKIIKLTDA